MSQDYPKAKYSKTEPVRVVQNEKEEKVLGPEWFDTPNFTNTKPGSPGQLKLPRRHGAPDLRPVPRSERRVGPVDRRHGAPDSRALPHVERRAK